MLTERKKEDSADGEVLPSQNLSLWVVPRRGAYPERDMGVERKRERVSKRERQRGSERERERERETTGLGPLE